MKKHWQSSHKLLYLCTSIEERILKHMKKGEARSHSNTKVVLLEIGEIHNLE